MSCFFDNLLPIMFASKYMFYCGSLYHQKKKKIKISNSKQTQKFTLQCWLITRILEKHKPEEAKLQKSSK